MVVTFAALALAMPVMVWSGARPLTPQDDVWAVALWVVVIGSPAVGTAFYLLHCRIVADARGLWIYGWHPRLGIAWEAIQDYELRFPTSNQGGAHDGSGTGASRAYIQSGGKWHHLSDLYLPRQPLLDTIACHAKWAKATGWHLAEIREDGDWPKIFEYHDESGWKLVGMYLGMSFGLSAQIWIDGLFKGFGPMLAGVAEIWRFLSPWGRVGFALMPVVTCGSLPLIFLTRYPAIVTRRRYLGQQMKATREGIALFRNSRQTFFRWEEIESYHLEALPGSFQPTRCVIQSNGQRIEFLSNIAEIKALQKLIQTRATNATTTQWLHPHGEEDDLFGGAASLYADGIVGAGPKTHHYRTRTTRAMITLGFVMLIPLIVSLFTGTRNGLPADKSDDWMLLFFGTCVGLPTLGALLAFRFSWLRPEENGLRQNSIWGERFLPWHEIHKLAFNGHYYIVAGQNRIIRFGAVADCEGLLAEIERRTGVESKRDGNAF